MYKRFCKPVFDLIAATLLLLVLSPIIALFTLIGLFIYKGKPFFLQQRIGFKENKFSIIKFRTMNSAVDANGKLQPDEKRIDPYGKFLRKSSIDELPQLLNILTGDMSFIGPRPLFTRYLPYYTPAERERHDVKPGITGLAQVSGRNLLSWEERLSLDLLYANTVSFKLDMNILVRTLKKIFVSKEVVTGPRFDMRDLDIERSYAKQHMVNEFFILRRPVHADADQLLTAKNNTQAAALLEVQNHGYTISDIHKWIDFHLSNNKNHILLIEDVTTSTVIGHVGLYNIDLQSKSCDFGILIGLPEYWGKGTGKTVSKVMFQVAADQFAIDHIYISVLSRNTKVITLYQNLGFYKIGEDSIMRDGVPETLVRMQYAI